jgi:ABC-type Fe3+-hydroxamate transport system substrate-binding protein
MFISEKDSQNFSVSRIVCLVPSITELLYDLGLSEEVKGITKFCVHPKDWKKEKQQIGGTKNINIEKIKALDPDLIICSKEENIKDQVEKLAKSFSVYITDVQNYEDALLMIKNIGTLTNKVTKANEIIEEIKCSFKQIKKPNKKITTAYLIWKKPYMSVGGNTYIDSMLQKIGFQNIYSSNDRYPTVTLKELKTHEPNIILLSSEPYPFSEKHIEELKPDFPKTKLVLVDGELFSWYGSRMLYAANYFKKLLVEVEME